MNRDAEKKGLLGLSRTIVVLGVVSLLTDLSTEMLLPLIPLFLTNVLAATGTQVGIIEGFAESIASLLRIIAGWLSDRFGKPKFLATAGYGLSSVSKPFLALTTSWLGVFAVRVADRFGKGIRSAPRDVIITESVAPENRGKAFGFHRAMDTAGATLGPLVAFLIFAFVKSGAAAPYRLVFILGAVPALLAVIVLWALVPERAKPAKEVAPPKIEWSAFSPRLKMFLLVVGIFSLGNSSDAFLILRSQSLGVSIAHILLIYVLFNAVSAIFAMPAGIASDRVGRRPVLFAGMIIFAAVYLGFGLAKTSLAAWILFATYGIYGGLTGGVLRAYAADLAPANLRGTVIGAYYTIEGLTLLPASVIAGILWDRVGKPMPFYYGAAMAILAALVLLFLVPSHDRPHKLPVADSE